MRSLAQTTARTRIVAIVGALLLTLWLAGSAHAAVFDVNSTNDKPDADTSGAGAGICADADGNCTLRAAIDEANASSADDQINVPPGRYKLTIPGSDENQNAEGDLDINWNGNAGNLVIDGTGSTADTIVDGNGLDRVFHVFEGTDVTLSDLTVTGGFNDYDVGGGILNESLDTLTLDRVRVTRNDAADDDGGGVANHGHLVVNDSTIDRNTADDDAGGILTTGQMEMTNSTVNDNGGQAHGGGILIAVFRFLAIPHQDQIVPDVSITNSTIDGNNSDINNGGVGHGGGIDLEGGALSLLNVTLSDNETLDDDSGGGGIWTSDSSTVEFKNTLVANNLTMGFADNCEIIGGFVDAGNNLDTEDNCGFADASDITDANAGLARLSDNGGPTHTRALLSGSDAFDTGDNSACPAKDQRGVDRPPTSTTAGPNCDIGAFELSATPAAGQPVQTVVQQQLVLQQLPPAPLVQPAPKGCKSSPPRTSISRNGIDVSNTTLRFVGRSIDLLCQGQPTPGGIKKVQIGIGYVVGSNAAAKRCRFLTSSGDLGPVRSCSRPSYLKTRLGKVRNGKVPWTFRMRQLDLPNGKYVVIARGTDTQNAVETQIRKYNKKQFTVH